MDKTIGYCSKTIGCTLKSGLESNSSLCACKAIDMIEGCLPVLNQVPSIHENHSSNIVLSSHRTDADNSVGPFANLRGTIPYSSPQKVLLNDSLSKNTCHVASGSTQQDFTSCTYCSYDDTNVSGINLTSSVIPDNSKSIKNVIYLAPQLAPMKTR